MNSLFTMLGIESWKPFLVALMLPPVPFLVMALIGARLILPRRGLGWLVVLFSVAGLWITACAGTAQLLETFLIKAPPALTQNRITEIKSQQRGDSKNASSAIVILGAGKESFAPEYGVSNLSAGSLERLRYGLWLSRETGLPVAFSGGTGWAQNDGAAEADIASRVASQEFNRPIRWIESQSRDTRTNAAASISLLKASGIKHVILVTHGWHMPRAVAAFEQSGLGAVTIEAAPMGLAQRVNRPELDWLPSVYGFSRVHHALREAAAKFLGA
ncbi:MAG: YdcF family protein [Rhizobacter sp.]